MKNSLEPVWKEDWEAVVEEAMDQTLDLDMWDKLLFDFNLISNFCSYVTGGTRTTLGQTSSWDGQTFPFQS